MEHRGGAPVAAGGLKGLPHLSGDLRLAEDQGAQSGGDLVEVLGDGIVHRRVEAERDHLAVQAAGAGDGVEHQVHALVEAVGVEVDLEPVAGADDDFAGDHRSGAGGDALALELLDHRREGVRSAGQRIEHLEVEVLVGGTESGEHGCQCRPVLRAAAEPGNAVREPVHNRGAMSQNPMSEPLFGDSASDRSRHLSEPGNAAGPGHATAPAIASTIPPEGSAALPPEHPAQRPIAEGGVADASLLDELRGVRTAPPPACGSCDRPAPAPCRSTAPCARAPRCSTPASARRWCRRSPSSRCAPTRGGRGDLLLRHRGPGPLGGPRRRDQVGRRPRLRPSHPHRRRYRRPAPAR